MSVFVDEATLVETEKVTTSIHQRVTARLAELDALGDRATDQQRREQWSLRQLLKAHA